MQVDMDGSGTYHSHFCFAWNGGRGPANGGFLRTKAGKSTGIVD
jgi:hypothetical protein